MNWSHPNGESVGTDATPAMRYLLYAFGLLLTCSSASAQWLTPLELPWESAITQRELDEIATACALTDDQRVTLEMMAKDHWNAFQALVKLGQKESDEMRRPAGGLEDLTPSEREVLHITRQKADGEVAQKLAETDQAFLDSVALVLTTEQQELWPLYLRERLVRRLNTFHPTIPGSNIYLRHVLDEMTPPVELKGELPFVCHEYEFVIEPMMQNVLDTAIRNARQSYRYIQQVHKMNEELREAMVAKDLQRYEKISRVHSRLMAQKKKREIASQLAVKQTNDSFIERIAAELPPDRVDEFRLAVKKAIFPSIYIEDKRIQNEHQRIIDLCDLSVEQEALLRAAVGESNAGIAAAHDAAASKTLDRLREDLAGLETMLSQYPNTDEIAALDRMRDEIVTKGKKHLFEILDDQQRSVVQVETKTSPSVAP